MCVFISQVFSNCCAKGCVIICSTTARIKKYSSSNSAKLIYVILYSHQKARYSNSKGRIGHSLGIAPTDVFIVINEPPLENWGMGGVQKN